jgi:hypothetical protein
MAGFRVQCADLYTTRPIEIGKHFVLPRMEAHSGCKLVVLTGDPKGIGG